MVKIFISVIYGHRHRMLRKPGTFKTALNHVTNSHRVVMASDKSDLLLKILGTDPFHTPVTIGRSEAMIHQHPGLVGSQASREAVTTPLAKKLDQR
jgi:hypothetical protein